MTYTPGQWSVVETKTGLVYVKDRLYPVATIFEVRESQIANAHLVAAAPDLIAAAKAVRQAIEAGSGLEQAAEQLDQAINRAEGAPS